MIAGLDHLLDYTEWQRAYWSTWLCEHDAAVLDTNAGPGGDGRFETIRDLIRHIFWAERRYMERLAGLPLSEPSSVPAATAEQLFEFGRKTRAEFRRFLAEFPESDADTGREMTILTHAVIASPRKIVTHVVLHEI